MTRNIRHVLFIIRSRDQKAFPFNTSAIRRGQDGLHIIDALPRREGRLARRLRDKVGGLNFMVAVHIARAIAENLSHLHPHNQLPRIQLAADPFHQHWRRLADVRGVAFQN